MRIPILFEDEKILVIDKPVGVSVQAGQERKPSPELQELVGDKKFELVHRLDRDTSGVMILAKDTKTKELLQTQFKKRTVDKVYLALVHGVPKLERAVIDWPIGRRPKNPLKRAVVGRGKQAITEYRVIGKSAGYSLLEARPQTGRTHQIRVHVAHLGHPILGDRLYGKRELELGRMWLHARKLSINLPNGQRKTFTSPLPVELKGSLKRYNIAI